MTRVSTAVCMSSSFDKEARWSDITTDEGSAHSSAPTSELHRALRTIDYDDDDDDSQEPYYNVYTGKIVLAREAWIILANEGHPRFCNTIQFDNNSMTTMNVIVDTTHDSAPSQQIIDASTLEQRHQTNNDSSIEDALHNDFITTAEENILHKSNNSMQHLPMVLPPKETLSSFLSSSAVTQHSIDMALNKSVDSHNHISPKHEDNNDKKLHDDEVDNDMTVEETDPSILRATAMALAAAQGGQKKILTPQQLQLIATPDIQQQKLIMVAKRAQKAKEIQSAQQKWVEVQQIGMEFGKFIQTETREKPVLEWGKDIGKFIESKMTTEGGEGGGIGEGDDPSSPQRKMIKKKMEGFGSEPAPYIETTPAGGTQPTTTSLAKGNILSNMKLPTIPNLNESIANIIFPITATTNTTTATSNDTTTANTTSTTIKSAILWKRRSGIGKLISTTTSKAWEKRRVDLCGSKLIYYSTPDEDIDEAQHECLVQSSRPTTPMESNIISDSIPTSVSRHPTTIENDEDTNITTTDEGEYHILKSNTNDSTTSATTTTISSSKRLYEGLMQMASNGLDSLKHQPMLSTETPRGAIDLIKEYANISVVSTGHLYATSSAAPPPTPYCLTITTKLDIRWEFSFTNQSSMMEWLMALTNVIIRSSVVATKNDGWLIEDYDCIQRARRVDESNNKAKIDLETKSIVTAPVTQRISADALVALSTSSASSKVIKTNVASLQRSGTTNQLTISGINIYVAWASANIALILARCSLTTTNQYWSLVVFTNVGLWQLCLHKRYDEIIDTNNPTQTLENYDTSILLAKQGSYKPIAGTTTVKVIEVEDPEITGHKLPTWLSVSSSCFEVRSHGYLTTKKKISCPGELYECIAMDCFVSNTRVPEIAPRVRFGKEFNTNWKDTKKTWVSPDIFVVSLSIPTEAPTFGKSTDDGPGATFIGYYKMKDETRRILSRITATGYDPITDTSDGVDEVDVQKRITNGVRLWEKYCQVAPLDPTFQARFKLIPMGNLEELGCPSYISKYSGKPVLIKRNQVTGFFYNYPTLSCMEFDISLHPFPYLFKQGVAYLKDYFERTVWTLGFVIEGRSDDELPEVVIGTMKVCHPNPKFVVNGEDLFDGKCA